MTQPYASPDQIERLRAAAGIAAPEARTLDIDAYDQRQRDADLPQSHIEAQPLPTHEEWGAREKVARLRAAAGLDRGRTLDIDAYDQRQRDDELPPSHVEALPLPTHEEWNAREKVERLRAAAGLEPVRILATEAPRAPLAVPVVPALKAEAASEVQAAAMSPELERKALAQANLELNPIGALLGTAPAPLPEARPAASSAAEAVSAPTPAPPAPETLVSKPPPLVSEAPQANMSIETGKVDPSKARFAASGGSSGGSGPKGVDTSEYERASGEERAIIDAQLAFERAKGRGGYSPPTKQHEQPLSVQRQRAAGYDPELQREEEAIQGNPGALVDASPKAPPPLTYEPKALLQIFQPPPEAKTPKEREAWAGELAKDAAAKGVSLATLMATLEPRAPIYPKGLLQRGSAEEIESFEAAHKEAITGLAQEIDADNAKKRAGFDAAEGKRIEGARAVDERLRADYGERGQLGGEQQKGRLEAQGHEDTAAAEREMAQIARDSAAQQGAALAKIQDKEEPGVLKKILQGVALVVGAASTGFVEGPTKAMDFVRGHVESGAKLATDKLALQKGIELSRYGAIEHDLRAKLALGLGEKASITVQQMLGKLRLEQIRVEKELSAATRGTETTASKIVPATAGGYGGGTSLERLRKLVGEQRGIAKESVDVGAKALGEAPKKSEKPERAVLAGITYHLENVTSPTEGKEARDQMASLDKMELSFKALERESQNYGTRLWNSGRFENLVNEFAYDASNAKKQGVVRDPEMVAKVKALGSYTGGLDVIGDFRTIIANGRSALLTQLGAKPVR